MKWVAAMVTCIGLSACSSSSFCDDEKATYDDLLTDTLDDCSGARVLFAAFGKTSKECEDAYAQCNESDRKILGDLLSCFRSLPKCTAATSVSFGFSAAACTASRTPSLSSTCKTAWAL